MSTSSAPTPKAEPTTPKKAGRWTCLIWFGIAYLIIHVFGIHLAGEDAHAKKYWDLHEAKITESRTHHQGLESGWEIQYTFEVAFPDETRSYSSSQVTSRGSGPDEPVTGQFAVGNTFPIYINPKDRSEFHRPLRERRLPWVAVLGGGFFGLMGLMVLFAKR